MALQKSGAPQGSYMLSIVADNPNQTMYLASADNAAKLSQEELSAIASEKMVPLLNQQKYPEAVLAYLDALSAKAPEMGSGLAVAPWAMIAFLVALIVVIIVISRVLRARRKAQNRTEDNASGESTEALASQDSRSQLPAFAVGTWQGGVTESEASTSKESSKTAVVDEDDHEDEQPSKGKFRLRFGRNAKSSGKSKSGKTPVDNPDTAKAVSENFAGAASSQPAAAALLQTPSTDAGLVNKEPNLTSVAGTAQVKAEEPNPAIPTGVPGTLNTSSSGKVPSLAELDQIALARTRAQTTNSTEANAGYQVSPAPQMQVPTSSQLPPQSEERALPQAPAPAPALSGEQPALSPQAAPLQPVQPEAAAQETRPGTFAPESTGLPATAPAQVSATTPRSNASYTSLGASSPLAPATGTSSAPQRHDSVLRPGETTYLPPQAMMMTPRLLLPRRLRIMARSVAMRSPGRKPVPRQLIVSGKNRQENRLRPLRKPRNPRTRLSRKSALCRQASAMRVKQPHRLPLRCRRRQSLLRLRRLCLKTLSPIKGMLPGLT